MGRLYIKSFGPLQEIDIILKSVNLFIGENGSGKSVLAKTISVVLDITDNHLDEKKILEKFKDYNIDFMNDETIIRLTSSSGRVVFQLENNIITQPFRKDMPTSIIEEYDSTTSNMLEARDRAVKSLKNLQLIKPKLDGDDLQKAIDIEEELTRNLNELLRIMEDSKNTYNSLKKFSTQYIPAERIFTSLFNQSLSTFITSEVPLPKFLLNFSSEYAKARQEIQELEFLNVKYHFKDGKENIFYNENDSVLLEHSSSGIQVALPLYLTLKYFANKHQEIVVEEPELNLFPKGQYETIKYMIGEVSKNNELFIMTHSPYVLSTINNLLFAYKISKLNEKAKDTVSQILEEKYWIDIDKFSAYYIENGKARNIIGDRGLISENEIDEISEDIADEFDAMMEIYRTNKNEK